MTPQSQASPEKQTAETRRRRLMARLAAGGADKIFVPAIVIVVAGFTLWLVNGGGGDTSTQQGSSRTIVETVVQQSPSPPPSFAETTRGSRTETLRISGSYNGQDFIAQSALALNIGQGIVRIRFYPFRIACSTASSFPPRGLYLNADVYVAPGTLRALPIARPLAEFGLWWQTIRERSSNGDGADDGASMTLSEIDTKPGGFWYGTIRGSHQRSAGGKIQTFGGTFAAEWCDHPA